MKKKILIVLGFLSFANLALADAVATPWKPHERQNTKDMIACKGKYTLCSQAVCSTSADGKRANCQCPVYTGNNLGGTSCDDRQAAVKDNDVYSDYSAIHLLGSKANNPVRSQNDSNLQKLVGQKLFDPGYICNIPDGASFSYADCMDIKCKNNGDGTANCNCPIYPHKKDSAFMMEASSCKKAEEMCKFFTTDEQGYVVNSAPTLFGFSVIEASLKQFNGTTVQPSMICSLKDTKQG